MASTKKFMVTDAAVEVLRNSRTEGKVLFLPDTTLERSLYTEVNKALLAMGAKWNRSAKGHVFNYDICDQLAHVIATKEVVDWKKMTEFFHTPKAVVQEMLAQRHDTPGDINIMEPSAGMGHILDEVSEVFPGATFTVIEQNPNHCAVLSSKGYQPICSDFMEVEPHKDIDLIFMNPPFTYEVEHIRHAFEFLKEGGQLISVTSGNILDKSAKKNKEFAAWFNSSEVVSYCMDITSGSFKESGTDVATKILVIRK